MAIESASDPEGHSRGQRPEGEVEGEGSDDHSREQRFKRTPESFLIGPVTIPAQVGRSLFRYAQPLVSLFFRFAHSLVMGTLRESMRCHTPTCVFRVHMQAEFGGFCCRKCHWRWVNRSTCKVKHGAHCEMVYAPHLRVAPDVAPELDVADTPVRVAEPPRTVAATVTGMSAAVSQAVRPAAPCPPPPPVVWEHVIRLERMQQVVDLQTSQIGLLRVHGLFPFSRFQIAAGPRGGHPASSRLNPSAGRLTARGRPTVNSNARI